MSLNDSTLEGDYYNTMSNYSSRPWHGDGRAPASRTMVDSYVGVTVAVITLDSVELPGALLCKLLEVSPKGFLLRVQEPRGVWGFPHGIVVFASSCSFRAATLQEEKDAEALESDDRS